MNRTEQGKLEILGLLVERSPQYTHAVVRAALALDSGDGEWKNCVTTVQMSEGETLESKSLVFPGLEIHESVTDPEHIARLIGHLVDEGQLHIESKVIALKDGRFDKLGFGQRNGQRVPSEEGWVPSKWPGDQYLFAARREISPPGGALVALDLPAYPDAYAAIEHTLGLDCRGGHTWDGGVFFLFPDYRARIDRVTLGIEGLSVKIENKRAQIDQIVGKIYVKSSEGQVHQRDVEFHTLEERIDLPFQPEHAYIGLIHRPDGQLLDQWEYSPFRPSPKLKIEDFTPNYVGQLIGQGENAYVEYKPGTRDETAKGEIAESAIAFANTNGGIILVGVDRNARVEGAFGDGWAELVAQAVRDRSEPPVEVLAHRVVLEGKPVYVVSVSESDNKPHLLKGGGVIYIRVSSTDKPATRYELDELYKSNRQRPSLNPYNPLLRL